MKSKKLYLSSPTASGYLCWTDHPQRKDTRVNGHLVALSSVRAGAMEYTEETAADLCRALGIRLTDNPKAGETVAWLSLDE